MPKKPKRLIVKNVDLQDLTDHIEGCNLDHVITFLQALKHTIVGREWSDTKLCIKVPDNTDDDDPYEDRVMLVGSRPESDYEQRSRLMAAAKQKAKKEKEKEEEKKLYERLKKKYESS